MKLYMKSNERICEQFHTRYCYDECNWFGNCLDQIRGEELEAEDRCKTEPSQAVN